MLFSNNLFSLKSVLCQSTKIHDIVGSFRVLSADSLRRWESLQRIHVGFTENVIPEATKGKRSWNVLSPIV